MHHRLIDYFQIIVVFKLFKEKSDEKERDGYSIRRKKFGKNAYFMLSRKVRRLLYGQQKNLSRTPILSVNYNFGCEESYFNDELISLLKR